MYRNYRKLSPLEHKTLTKRKRALLGLPTIVPRVIGGGRNHFREIIRARDDWTCQMCFKKWVKGKRRFDVHHLDEKKDGKSRERGIGEYDRNNPDKLITLCHKCHFSLDVTKNKIRKSLLTQHI